MKNPRLTLQGPNATFLPMQDETSGIGHECLETGPLVSGPSVGGRRMAAMAVAATGAAMLGGCISVNAPDKPIVIELNINIRQEVIYRLAEDAGNTIEENADIF